MKTPSNLPEAQVPHNSTALNQKRLKLDLVILFLINYFSQVILKLRKMWESPVYNLGNLKLSSMKLNSYKLPEDLSVASVKEKEENL